MPLIMILSWTPLRPCSAPMDSEVSPEEYIALHIHTLNLTAKATLCQFEKRKGKKKKRTNNENDPDFNDLPLLKPVDTDSGDEDDEGLPDIEDLPDSEMIGDEGEKAETDEEEIVNVFETLTEEEWDR